MKENLLFSPFSFTLRSIRMPVVSDTSLQTPVSAVAAGCGGVGPAVPAPVAMSTQQHRHQQHQQHQQQRPSARKQPLQQVDENGIENVCSSSSLSLAAAAAASAAAHAPVPPPELEHSLVDRVRSSLELHMMDNALFLAERLVADFPSEVRILSIRFFFEKPIDLLFFFSPFSLPLKHTTQTGQPPPPRRRPPPLRRSAQGPRAPRGRKAPASEAAAEPLFVGSRAPALRRAGRGRGGAAGFRRGGGRTVLEAALFCFFFFFVI